MAVYTAGGCDFSELSIATQSPSTREYRHRDKETGIDHQADRDRHSDRVAVIWPRVSFAARATPTTQPQVQLGNIGLYVHRNH